MVMVDKIIQKLEVLSPNLSKIDGLHDMFKECFMSTLSTTYKKQENAFDYIITGDINAMWLRDSTEQVLHYLRFSKDIEEIKEMICSVLQRQAMYVIEAPYANAFNFEKNGRHGYQDLPKPSDMVWEEKYELDSLCHVLLLAKRYFEKTNDQAFLTPLFVKALHVMLDVMQTELYHDEKSPYRFVRSDCPPSDTLSHDGKGAPVAFTGMTWCGFRPSDDACKYGYLVPANLFALSMLPFVKEMAGWIQDEDMAQKAQSLMDNISKGIEQYGILKDEQGAPYYIYETDGRGNTLFMDDANIPGLLSLPYLGVLGKNDPLYINTRKKVLSAQNPFYYEGQFAKGVGSPHTPEGYVWPIALCVQGMTSTSVEEKSALFQMLITTHADTTKMHESFDPQNPNDFTRTWFAWANSMFGEFVYRLYEDKELDTVVQNAVNAGILKV